MTWRILLIAIILQTDISARKLGVRLLRTAGGSRFNYEEITAQDKTSLDITWLKDKLLADLDKLPAPDVLAEMIADNLESALGNFGEIIVQLKKKDGSQ